MIAQYNYYSYCYSLKKNIYIYKRDLLDEITIKNFKKIGNVRNGEKKGRQSVQLNIITWEYTLNAI